MGSLLWIASYPKSGNTWVRAFLTAYLRDEPVRLDDMEADTVASNRALFDEYAGVEAADLLPSEVSQLRPAIYAQLAAESTGMVLLKAHDPFRLPGGPPLFPPAVSRAIYIVRDPRDVAVSLAHHNNWTVERAVDAVCHGYRAAPTGRALLDQLEQRLPAWSDHVRSWLEAAREVPLHVVRYEDLLADAPAHFAGLLDFYGAERDEARLTRAVDATRFERLRRQEAEHGFQERPPRAVAFFRSGNTGQWAAVLPPALADRIAGSQAELMRELGYLP
ncbi:MAG: sulfotransferase domain-containing protein [Vicinamibacterales bacterium]